MIKQYFNLIITLLVILATPFMVSGEINDANELNELSDYLSYAALNNAGLKAKFQDWKAALQQIPQAKALNDPKFTYSYFIEEVETRVGPQQNKFGIMQTFPWFGKLEARGNAAAAKAKAVRKQYQTAKLKLFQEVKSGFYEFSYLAIAIETAKENFELLKHFEEVARTKYRSSEATHPDVIHAQIELATLEDVLESLEKLKEPTIAKLNSALNRNSDAKLDWPKKEEPFEIELVREDIIRKVVRRNPELAELNWKREAAKAELEIAKKNFYPDIGVGVDWIQIGEARTAGVRDSGKDAVALMFSVNIPLWRDKYKAAEPEAKANVRKYREQKIDAQNKKIYQALQIIYDIEDSKRKMELYGGVLVLKAEELVKASESAYRSGSVDFLSLIDAQRMLLKYQLNYHRAITDNQQSIAELESLIGE